MKKIMMLCALLTGFLSSAQNSLGKQDCSTVTLEKTSKDIPFYEAVNGDIVLRKYFDEGSVDYLLVLNVASYQEGSKGLSVLLGNNAKIERPDTKLIPVNKAKGGKVSFASILLEPKEIELLKNNEIIKTTIAGVESTIKTGAQLKNYFNCLIGKELPAIGCYQIITEKNESKGGMSYQTPLIDGIRFKKVSQDGIDLYLGSVTVPSKTKLSGNGVLILFNDGQSIIDNNAKILENPLKDGTYEYVGLFIIKNEDMKLFSTHLIRGVSVNDAVALVNKKDEIQKLATCLINK